MREKVRLSDPASGILADEATVRPAAKPSPVYPAIITALYRILRALAARGLDHNKPQKAVKMSGAEPLPCFSADNDVEGLSRAVQRLHPVPAYFQPIVAGRGAAQVV